MLTVTFRESPGWTVNVVGLMLTLAAAEISGTGPREGWMDFFQKLSGRRFYWGNGRAPYILHCECSLSRNVFQGILFWKITRVANINNVPRVTLRIPNTKNFKMKAHLPLKLAVSLSTSSPGETNVVA